MAYGISLLGIEEVPGITLLNNSTALDNDDIGKPVVMSAANDNRIALASDGDVFVGILGAVDPDTLVVTVLHRGFHEVTASGSSDAPDPTSATPYVVANGSGGVKKSTTATPARVISYDSTAETAIIYIG